MTVGLLRGHAHFLFDTKKELLRLFTSATASPSRQEEPLFSLLLTVLLMSPLMWEMSAGREDWGG